MALGHIHTIESNLSVEDHVDPLVDDVLGVVTQELQDVLHLRHHKLSIKFQNLGYDVAR